ncbi:hypothetical protein [Streptomyces sp. NP160]|uniref:hypothetical protein n=1 Tax=Streptomyces sp. NP160 TaxID=2586637 RepID=UPI0015D5F262|nr:hypothetical protein [Streptomyces sp. NP160]
MSPGAAPAARGGAAALVVVLLLTGCAGGVTARTPPAGTSQAPDPLPPGPLLTTDDLDGALPGLSADAGLRPRWELRDDLWELSLLRARCGADPASSAAAMPAPSGPVTVEHRAEQWWQGTSPQYATLDVLRWPDGEGGGAQAWVDGAVAAEATCREAVVLPEQPGADGGPEVTAVVRPWEVPHSGGGPGTRPLPQWQVGGFAVDGSTALVVRAGQCSAPTAQAAWELAAPGLPALLARVAQRAERSTAASSSS